MTREVIGPRVELPIVIFKLVMLSLCILNVHVYTHNSGLLPALVGEISIVGSSWCGATQLVEVPRICDRE